MKVMKNFGLLFVNSAKELKNIRHLVLISLFTALIVVGEIIRIPIMAGSLEIRFSFIFAAATGFFFGPVASCMARIVSDLLAYIISPGGAFHIGFTFNAALGGLIYGVFLYRKNHNSPFFIIYIMASKALVNLAINIFLTPIWLFGLFGSAGKIFTVVRIYKNVVMLPIEIIVIFIVLKSLSVVLKRANLIDQ